MNGTTQKGFLILADITGFTPFMADSELVHSNEILNDILKGILSFLTPTFSLAEVEGDAVFVYAPLERFPHGKTTLDIIESAYNAFRDKKQTFSRLITCNCKACQMAPSLDLKFIIHYGEYIMNNVGGKAKPLGTSVNIAHRLLKNSISEVMGWKAYVLLTRDCVDAIGLDPVNYHQQTEWYDHLGEIETFSIDLDEVYRNSVMERSVYLSKEDADIVVHRDFPIPPALLWVWLNDPKERSKWNLESDWVIGARPKGRPGKGSTNHCVNSKITESILDYRPFHYYTSSMKRGPFHLMLTSEFQEIPSGTRLSWHAKLKGFLPKRICRFLCKFLFEKGIKVNESFDKLSGLIASSTYSKESGNGLARTYA
jgi:hypothetical protein